MLVKNLGCRPVALKKSGPFAGIIEGFRIYLKEILVAVLDFQNALSIFQNIKNLENLKLKLFILSLCFREKDKIKEIKQKE